MTARPLDLPVPILNAPAASSATRVVVGLDLSLSSTGIAHATVNGIVTDTLRGRGRGIERLRQLAKDIRSLCLTADLIVLEGPAFHMGANAGFHERAGLHWMVLERLHLDQRTVVQVAPTVVKKYATGKGNANKGAMVEATTRRYPHVDTGGDDNQCDALWLATLGLDHLTGQHVVPEAHRSVLASVTWPRVEAA